LPQVESATKKVLKELEVPTWQLGTPNRTEFINMLGLEC
jgi:hypothetical protein